MKVSHRQSSSTTMQDLVGKHRGALAPARSARSGFRHRDLLRLSSPSPSPTAGIRAWRRRSRAVPLDDARHRRRLRALPWPSGCCSSPGPGSTSCSGSFPSPFNDWAVGFWMIGGTLVRVRRSPAWRGVHGRDGGGAGGGAAGAVGHHDADQWPGAGVARGGRVRPDELQALGAGRC